MSAGFRPRTFLNRGDPRLRGILTWIPMDGHFTNMGDVGGQVPPPPSTGGWQPSPLAGTFWLNDTLATTRDAELTPANMGADGAKPRTVFFEHYHSSVATFSNMFAFGDAVATNAFGCFKVNATTLRFSDFNTTLDITLPVSTGQFVRAAIRYNGTNVTIWTRTYDPTGNSWAEQTASGAYSLATTGLGLGLHYWVAGATVDSASGLSYLGIVGGYAWSDEETRAFLRDPSPLWSPGPSKARYYFSPSQTYNDTIADSATAADSVTATLTTGATVSDAATGADSLSVALTARPTLSDGATAADSTAAAATANASTSDVATGGDASAAALTANAATSDAVTAGDAVVGGKATADTITDTVAGADGLAAALTASPAISDAAAGADSQAAALTARPTLSDSAAASDVIAPALTTAAAIADGATAADAVTGAKVTAGTIADGATAGEAATVAATFAVTLSDGATAGDGVTGTTGEPIADAVTAGDAFAVSATIRGAITDDVAADDDVTATGGTPAAPATSATGGGPLVPMPRRRRWRVRTPGGLLEAFDTAEAAYARFEELYGDPTPAEPTRGKAAPRRISVPSIPPRTVALGDADATRSFARLLRDMQAEREGEARARVAAMLDQIAFDAARRAAQLEDDDEAAAVLLLM